MRLECAQGSLDRLMEKEWITSALHAMGTYASTYVCVRELGSVRWTFSLEPRCYKTVTLLANQFIRTILAVRNPCQRMRTSALRACSTCASGSRTTGFWHSLSFLHLELWERRPTLPHTMPLPSIMPLCNTAKTQRSARDKHIHLRIAKMPRHPTRSGNNDATTWVVGGGRGRPETCFLHFYINILLRF
mgnify:CR=1 FL=1